MNDLIDIRSRVSSHHKKIRNLFSLKQDDIARKIGLGRTTISKTESRNNEFKITKPNMLLTAFIFKNELEKKKKILNDIDYENSDYKTLTTQLKKAGIDITNIKKFWNKHGKQLIKSIDENKMKMWLYILSDLFKNPDNINLDNDFFDKELLRKIICDIINYQEFVLKDVFFGPRETFDVDQSYKFDPYEFLDYVAEEKE